MFPSPYPDELFYSLMARFHFWSRGKSCSNTIGELLGNQRLSAIVDFPCGLGALSARLTKSPLLQADAFIQNNTLIPFYQPFLSSKTVSAAIDKMKVGGNQGGGVHSLFGYSGSNLNLFPSHLRYCRECVEQDLMNYGETYWHRIHQINLLEECPQHHRPLELSSVPFRDRQHKYQFVDLNDLVHSLGMEHAPCDITAKRLWNTKLLSSNIQFLLEHHIPPIGLEGLRKRYVTLLQAAGYTTLTGKVNISLLSQDFITSFGQEFLSSLNCLPSPQNENNWLNLFARRLDSTINPMRHLLMMNFLNISASDFIADISNRHPFGNGPWPCLNVAADHFRKDVVHTVNIKTHPKEKDTLIGTFACECGFVYTRYGPEQNNPDHERYTYHYVKQYGEVWENKLKHMLEIEKKSQREVAKRFRVSWITVKKYSAHLAVNKRSFQGALKNTNYLKQMEYRNQWTNVQQEHPQKGKTELSQLYPRPFCWLKKYDKEWLNKNSPSLIKAKRYKPAPIDWKGRDEALLPMCQHAIQQLLSLDKPVRITMNSIGETIKVVYMLTRYRLKLPKTMSFIHPLLESHEDFQIRRIRIAAMALRERGEHLIAWKLRGAAHIDKVAVTDRVNKEIERMIKDYINSRGSLK
ncbi:TnsD family Tn7-like transposition protein [Paenibacillus odorifer]|uniref:TnsD family Tn7-like transposition protein n=1 Tax=Paenibacillus odorifer TaxID=189426 RepID=UPI002116FF62|nr:TnsD family Tn7-like transposition protein [Paenibacillus odorifer]